MREKGRVRERYHDDDDLDDDDDDLDDDDDDLDDDKLDEDHHHI